MRVEKLAYCAVTVCEKMGYCEGLASGLQVRRPPSRFSITVIFPVVLPLFCRAGICAVRIAAGQYRHVSQAS
jgi:hypothetical protein